LCTALLKCVKTQLAFRIEDRLSIAGMKISHLILISFFSILMLFSITTYINYNQSELVRANSEEFARSSVIVKSSNRFQRNFLNMVSGLRGYLLTNESFFIQTYDSAVIENEDILGELSALVRRGSEQKILLDDIRELHKYWVTEFASPLLEAKEKAVTDSGRTAFSNLYRVKVLSGLEKDVQRSLQQKFSDFTNVEYGFRDVQKELLDHSVSKTRSVSFLLTVISVVTGMCIAMFIAHYISSRIVRMVKLANNIAEGNYNVHIPDEGKNELSQLARSLNHMADILNRNISLLKRQRDELDQFAHIVSHDIKAPLRGIDNVVSWIEEDHRLDLTPKVREYLDLIKSRLVRAENLLRGLLDYARIGKEAHDIELVDVNELLTEILEDIPKREDIEIRIHPRMPILFAERVPLLQVFSNLITNAVKYHNKEDGKIKIYYKNGGDFYQFFVEDDGPGISSAYHEKIFQIFQTLQERDKFESTGVGLSIVKKILDDRNLMIKILSASGSGSIFYFTWPKTQGNAKAY
jgi:signal transduction histidine kinase